MTSVPVRARASDLAAAEWIKLRSLRSTYWVLLTAAVTALVISLEVCNADASQWPHLTAAQRAGFDPLADSFIGLTIAQLIFAALGVLTVTGEYSSGLIRTTLAAVPARREVLAAKAVVVCLVAVALTGLGLGALIRNAAAALAAVVALLFLAPSFLHGTSRWVVDVGNALPANAIRRLVSLHPWPNAPSVAEAVVVLVVCPAVALAAAAYVIRRRDA